MRVLRDGGTGVWSPGGETTGPPSESGDAPSSDLGADEFFHALQAERRRHTLRYLLENDGPVEVAELAEWITSHQHGAIEAVPDSEAYQRTYLSLYQSHLPKLDGLGLVDYDQASETVASTGTTACIEPYLDAPVERAAAPPTDDTQAGTAWRRYYAGASAVGTALLAVAWAGPVATLALSFRLVAAAVVVIHTAVTAAMLARRGF